jgi:hypothetical protein
MTISSADDHDVGSRSRGSPDEHFRRATLFYNRIEGHPGVGERAAPTVAHQYRGAYSRAVVQFIRAGLAGDLYERRRQLECMHRREVRSVKGSHRPCGCVRGLREAVDADNDLSYKGFVRWQIDGWYHHDRPPDHGRHVMCGCPDGQRRRPAATSPTQHDQIRIQTMRRFHDRSCWMPLADDDVLGACGDFDVVTRDRGVDGEELGVALACETRGPCECDRGGVGTVVTYQDQWHLIVR